MQLFFSHRAVKYRYHFMVLRFAVNHRYHFMVLRFAVTHRYHFMAIRAMIQISRTWTREGSTYQSCRGQGVCTEVWLLAWFLGPLTS